MISSVIFIAIVLLLIVFFIIASKKGWIVKNPRGGIFTAQVVMHQFSPKERQEAMEYVSDKQEQKQKRDARQDEDKD